MLRSLVPALAIAVAVSSSLCQGVRAQPAAGVTVASEDLDKDGPPELILENEFVRVELMTGEPPANQDEPVTPPAPPHKYGTRFTWAGWINNVVFKPTNRRWFINDGEHHWHGIPEEFDEAVKMNRRDTGEYDVIKVGIGHCVGSGICHCGSLKVVKLAPWTRTVENTPQGGKVVVFKQVFTSEFGYAYEYEKRFTLEPGEARFTVARALKNTGSKDINTVWYIHAFWGQATIGSGYDHDSWTVIPVKYRGDGPLAGVVDTASCLLNKPDPHGIWGPLAGELLAESWCAAGNRKTGDVFVERMDTPWGYQRVWTYPTTYSCEPFVVIDLKPGETKAWTVERSLGNGLSAVSAPGKAGTLDLALTPAAEAGKGMSLRVVYLPIQPEKGLEIRATVRAQAAAAGQPAPQEFTAAVDACSPTAPFCTAFDVPGTAAVCAVKVQVRKGAEVLADAERLLGPGLPSPVWNGEAKGAKAIILSQPDMRDNKPVICPPAAMLQEYFIAAGFAVTVTDPDAVVKPEFDWTGVQLFVVAGATRIPGQLVSRLESLVKDGGGLLLCGPLNLVPFEFSELLPVAKLVADVTVTGSSPRDGTREFIGVWRKRYQLQPAGESPITAGIPWYPLVFQDVARLQTVVLKPEAVTVLTYTPGPDVDPAVSSPALVTGSFGKGRVAVFASPVNWGAPPQHVIFSRLGEYHRKFFVQAAFWTAGVTQ